MPGIWPQIQEGAIQPDRNGCWKAKTWVNSNAIVEVVTVSQTTYKLFEYFARCIE